MRGYETTGVTTFHIEKKVDTGGILLQESVGIEPEDNYETLSNRLSEVGARVMAETLDRLAEGTLVGSSQVGRPTTAPKILRETALIDWNRSAVEIHNQIRGLSPEPAAFTTFESKTVKLFSSRVIESGANASPGEAVAVEDGRLGVMTGSGVIEILELQLEGKRRMKSSEFLRGRPLKLGTKFG